MRFFGMLLKYWARKNQISVPGSLDIWNPSLSYDSTKYSDTGSLTFPMPLPPSYMYYKKANGMAWQHPQMPHDLDAGDTCNTVSKLYDLDAHPPHSCQFVSRCCKVTWHFYLKYLTVYLHFDKICPERNFQRKHGDRLCINNLAGTEKYEEI
jgi:hypothetical protein